MKNPNPASQLAEKLSRFVIAVWEILPETIRQASVDYKTADKKTQQKIINTVHELISSHAMTLIEIRFGTEQESTFFDLAWENKVAVQKDLKIDLLTVSNEFNLFFPQNKVEIAQRLESGKFFCIDQNWWASRMLVDKAIGLLRNIARNQEKYLLGKNGQQPKKGGQGEKITKDEANDNWHNDDFTQVRWNGKRYTFNKTQARAVEYLWRNKRASEKSIGEYIGTDNENYRLCHTFRQKKGKKAKMHPAWKTMIVNDGKGIYALNEKKQESFEK